MRNWRTVGFAVVLAAGLLMADAQGARATRNMEVGSWTLRQVTALSKAAADQGVAVVPGGRQGRVITRGGSSVPADLRAAGWKHVGDPGAVGTGVLDAYQGGRDSAAKLFTLTTARGTRYAFRHRLAPGESYHNSFAAPAPGGRWFVSGEWGTMSRLLIFPLPHPVGASRPRPLRLAGTIALTHRVRNVQGCAFETPTRLVCATNDPHTDLFPVARQLLTITLAHPLNGRPVRATPRLIGAVPQPSGCPRPGEVEGVDVTGGRLRIAVNESCTHLTDLLVLTHEAPDANLLEAARYR